MATILSSQPLPSPSISRPRGCTGLLPHRQLLRDVWGPERTGELQYLRVYLAQLRRKLEDAPSRPRHLMTEPGLGHRFEP